MAAHLASENISILGTAVISGVDFETVFGVADAERASEIVDDNVGFSAGLHILAGTSREKLAAEARRNALRWTLPSYASRLAGRPLLIVTAATVSGREAICLQMPSRDSMAKVSHAHTSPRITATQHAGSRCSPGCSCGLTQRSDRPRPMSTATETHRNEPG